MSNSPSITSTGENRRQQDSPSSVDPESVNLNTVFRHFQQPWGRPVLATVRTGPHLPSGPLVPEALATGSSEMQVTPQACSCCALPAPATSPACACLQGTRAPALGTALCVHSPSLRPAPCTVPLAGGGRGDGSLAADRGSHSADLSPPRQTTSRSGGCGSRGHRPARGETPEHPGHTMPRPRGHLSRGPGSSLWRP